MSESDAISRENERALAYFQMPELYFWRWAERRRIMEWQNGITICFREELEVILIGLTHKAEFASRKAAVC